MLKVTGPRSWHISLCALLSRWWTPKHPVRTVFLVMWDGDMKVVNAYETQSGWAARWIGNDDQWSVLLPNGQVMGTSLVKAWMPHSGWRGHEFPSSCRERKGR